MRQRINETGRQKVLTQCECSFRYFDTKWISGDWGVKEAIRAADHLIAQHGLFCAALTISVQFYSHTMVLIHCFNSFHSSAFGHFATWLVALLSSESSTRHLKRKQVTSTLLRFAPHTSAIYTCSAFPALAGYMASGSQSNSVQVNLAFVAQPFAQGCFLRNPGSRHWWMLPDSRRHDLDNNEIASLI